MKAFFRLANPDGVDVQIHFTAPLGELKKIAAALRADKTLGPAHSFGLTIATVITDATQNMGSERYATGYASGPAKQS